MDNEQKHEQAQRRGAQRNEWLMALAVTAVGFGIYGLLQSTTVQDWWRARDYREEGVVAEIERDLELTEKGQRIYRATLPVVEAQADFNEHCDSHEVEVSLLGCYTGGRIYVYEITQEQLKDSNKVTAAHELLHAVWMRMSDSEKKEVKEWLEQVRSQHAEWAEDELGLYDDEARAEELYARAGTKLSELPAELEQHYAKYFQNRAKIVEYYENYQAPFNELKAKNAQLEVEILRVKQEIDQEKLDYTNETERVRQVIAEFNDCANSEGCFGSDAEFQARRAAVEQERTALEQTRETLNKKIEENNQRIDEYTQNQAMLGELSEAMNSNIVKETI